MKRCSKCGLEKPLSEFHKDASKKDGYRPSCKSCRLIYEKQYDPNDAEQREYHLKWRTENKERWNEYSRQWCLKNQEKVRATKRHYRAEHVEQDRERRQKWREENREKSRAQWHRYDARKKSLPATLTQDEWEQILIRYSFVCAYCSSSEKITQDHVIPVSQGGGYTADNIVPACQSCNSKKGGRTPKEARMELREIRDAVQ